MCDNDTVNDNEAHWQASSGLSRRQFNALAAGTAVTMMLPRAANAMTVVEEKVLISTPDGEADCLFVHPAEGKHAAVLIWPDILGMRPAFQQMGKRLAESGYSVLVVNPYYRQASYPVVEVGDSFQDPPVREKVLPMARALSSTTVKSDAAAFVNWLDSQASVDTQRQIGTMGYCMGGPFTMWTAGSLPDRIGAGASFHGGGLVTEKDDSPHLHIKDMQASYLVSIADNDDERRPEDKDTLKAAFTEAGLDAEIEVYDGALHGWCPPDSRVYNEAQAERAWARTLALFSTALA